MCFRPVEAALPVKCPACGTTNSNGAETCFKCGADLTAVKEAADGSSAPTGAAPTIPRVPSVPSAPQEPGHNVR
ncbi:MULTISPECIES: zinc ribbon domain-containing protein [unclassified Gordonibacter]|uniref:zinc ribbon domain-containing protein n=1 Tax=Gordonibacter TaxID=644652 RepID=UPI001F90F5F1|nr:zinc ribbon domain-containing protein [Candidatus Gordonibacter avicola]